MIIVSYDISDDKMRTNFTKMLKSNGAIRLQFSVYEVRNTKRIVNNLMSKIEAYANISQPMIALYFLTLKLKN